MQVLKALLATLHGPGSKLAVAEEQACRHLLAVAAAAIDHRRALWPAWPTTCNPPNHVESNVREPPIWRRRDQQTGALLYRALHAEWCSSLERAGIRLWRLT